MGNYYDQYQSITPITVKSESGSILKRKCKLCKRVLGADASSMEYGEGEAHISCYMKSHINCSMKK